MTATPEPASREETPEEFAGSLSGHLWRYNGDGRSDKLAEELLKVVALVRARDAIRDAAAEERGRLAGLEQAAKVADVWEPIGSMPADIAEKIKRIPAAKVEEFARLSAREAIASKIRSLGAGGSR